MGKRGQASIEYLTIVGFTMAVLTILLLVQMEQRDEQNTMVVSSQADRIARTIVDAAEEVYYLGEPAMTTIKIHMPPNVYNISISGRSLVFRITTSAGISDVVRNSAVNLTGNITPTQGIKYIKVKAKGDHACFYEEGTGEC